MSLEKEFSSGAGKAQESHHQLVLLLRHADNFYPTIAFRFHTPLDAGFSMRTVSLLYLEGSSEEVGTSIKVHNAIERMSRCWEGHVCRRRRISFFISWNFSGELNRFAVQTERWSDPLLLLQTGSKSSWIKALLTHYFRNSCRRSHFSFRVADSGSRGANVGIN